MRGKVTALLIFHQTKAFNELKAALGKVGIATKRAQSLAEARRAFVSPHPPLLAFVETELPDGIWSAVVSLSEAASSHVNVVVVGRKIDAHLYASAIEVGAFDYITPPFEVADLSHVVRCAVDNALARRARAGQLRPDAGRLLPVGVKSEGSA